MISNEEMKKIIDIVGRNWGDEQKNKYRYIMTCNIEVAILELKAIRDRYKNTQPLPEWYRWLVHFVIYEYLSKPDSTMTQSDILKRIGLVADIFTKHWFMYSPNFYIKQKDYAQINLGYATDEVESNKNYLGLLHYIISSADVVTDTFIDVFGKKGLVPAICANGFKHRYVFGVEKKLLVFQDAIKCPVKVFKYISEIQKEIEKFDNFYDRFETIKYLRGIYYFRGFELKENIYRLAAEYYFVSFFSSDYWENLQQEKGDFGENVITEDRIPIKRIKDFLNLTKEDFESLSYVYRRIKLDTTNFYEEFFVKYKYFNRKLNKRELLYLDVPKYIEENERFDFEMDDYIIITNKLCYCEGNWILAWKNPIKEDLDKQLVLKTIEEIFECFYKAEEKGYNKKIYVYKFRGNNKNVSNRIVFISNIDAEKIHIDLLRNKYGDYDSGKICKENFDNFYDTSLKYLHGEYR